MIRRSCAIIPVCLSLIFSSGALNSSYASEYSSGSSSVLGVGQSVRSAAMGSASSALNGSAEGSIWNPAMLAGLDRHSVSLSHLRLFESSELNSLAWGGSFDRVGAFGATLMRFGSEPFDEVSAWTTTGRSVEYSTVRATVSYARSLGTHVDFGVSGVVVAEELFEARDAGFGFDAGLVLKQDKFHVAALVRNLLAPRLQLGSRGERLNRIARFGASYNGLQLGQEVSLTFSADIHKEETRDPSAHAGIEVGLLNSLYLRGGVNDGELTFGAGIPLGAMTFDYSYESLENLDASHRFGFGIGFGQSSAERERTRQSRREAVGRAYAAHDRQARAFSAFTRGQEFSAAQQLDSAAVYYQLALALQPEYPASRSALDATQLRLVEIRDSVSREAQLVVTDPESRYSGAVVVFEELISQRQFKSAQRLLGSLDSTAVAEKQSDSLAAILIQEREKWRIESEADLERAERSGDLLVALDLYSALQREYPENSEYRAELTDLVGRLKSQDLISQAEQAIAANHFSAARSSLGAALALDPENSSALALLEELNAAQPAGGLEELSANPADWEKMSEALRLVREGELSAALKLLEELLVKYPNNSEVLRNKSQIELRLNKR